MRSSLLLLALAAANGVIASLIPSAKYVDKFADVASYLNSLTPVAKDVLYNQIGGPKIGADVSPNYPSFFSVRPSLDVNVASFRSLAL